MNELERLCDLAAAELLMPMEEFRSAVSGDFTLAKVEGLARIFGSSFEATAFRLVSTHPGIAVGGLLQYRLSKADAHRAMASTQQSLFFNSNDSVNSVPQAKYRRQSFYSSPSCTDEHIIRWNKSFDRESCVYTAAAKSGSICSAREALPNKSSEEGFLEVIRAPYQSDDSLVESPDLLFFWVGRLGSPDGKVQATAV